MPIIIEVRLLNKRGGITGLAGANRLASNAPKARKLAKPRSSGTNMCQ